jgi:hypothetical protein|tara:strand:- start:177 stop:461 length:285 start_codon:yes stop_codon:yes gene_type:complete
MRLAFKNADLDDESFALEAFSNRFEIKEVHLEGCHALTDRGIEAASVFLPNLQKITIKNCSGISSFVTSIIATNSEGTTVDYEAFKEEEAVESR